MFLRKKQRRSLPSKPVSYPSGTCARVEDKFYYLKGTKKYLIPSSRILKSHSFPRIVETSEIAISKYRLSGRLGFRDGTLIHNIGDGRMYLVEGNLRRHITSPDILDRLGATVDDFIVISSTELELHKEGEEIK